MNPSICRITNLEVGKVALLVERGGLETERVNNVVDLLSTLLERLLGFLSGGVGTCTQNCE